MNLYKKKTRSEIIGQQFFVYSLLAVFGIGFISLTLDNERSQEQPISAAFRPPQKTNDGQLMNVLSVERSKLISKKNVIMETRNAFPELDSPIRLTFKNYDPSLDLRVDFGDGQVKRLKSASISHFYKKTGLYEVKLLTENNKVLNTIEAIVSSPVQMGF